MFPLEIIEKKILWDYFIHSYSTIIISMYKKEGIKLKIIKTRRGSSEEQNIKGPKLLLSHIPFYKNNSFSLLKGDPLHRQKHTPSHEF